MSKVKKTTFVEKVLAFVKGGDDAKLAKFSEKLSKYYANNIASRQAEIDRLSDRIDDANEELEETILNVNLERINKTDSAESYCETYSKAVAQAKAKVDTLEEQVKGLEEEIKQLEELRDLIFGTETAQ
jgi:phage shock protein A